MSILGGTGQLGFGLALRLGRAGYSVCIGSRDAERARSAAEQASSLTGNRTTVGCLNEDAVGAADRLVIAAVPFVSHVPVLRSVAERWRPGQVLLDTTVPLATAIGGRPTHLVEPWHGSAAQQARAAIPEHVALAAGLHTISAAVLRDMERPLDQDTLICGDRQAKKVVSEALDGIEGLRVVDAGSLEMSRLLEGLTPLLIGINIRNKTHAGIQVTHLHARPVPEPITA
ncbi:NADPH-dependent F420 reductase [Mycobacterium sp. 852013-51886_SCH5428379]|uniref:NADPH-dependent F420 reductase n=1 Tax=Mycobacterium sp. 852013-51886_SCH5428379 TaxID=1834111 RepID=UPI0007FFAEC3|nr:NADPH-dependent F420 reductase [Mycobacterium sp. 852013-51886_SCH5428379]OBB57092.1 NADPH-dependent F420 reductase [Mycobacterium sp. 852013-51886_SCH5428379]